MIQAQLWYLSIFLAVRYIVSPDWIRKSSEVGSWLPEQDFLLRDPEVWVEHVCLRSLESLSVLWIRNVIYSGSGSTPYPFYLSIFGYYLNKKTLSSIKKRIYQLYAVFQLTLQYYIQSRTHRPKIKNTIFIYLLFHFIFVGSGTNTSGSRKK